MVEFDSLDERIMRFMHSFRHMGEAIFHHKLSRTEHLTMKVIICLSTKGDIKKSPVGIGVAMKAVAKALDVSPTMVTKTVTSLEKQGYVKRMSNEHDRRGVMVCFTQEGLDMWIEEGEKVRSFMKSVFDRLGKEKTDQFFSISEELSEIVAREVQKLSNK